MVKIRAVIAILAFCLILPITASASTQQEQTSHEYTEIFAAMTEEDYDALRKVVYWESTNAGCPITTDIAVIRTVMNRVLDPEWPDTVHEVIYQRGQFWAKNFSKKVTFPEQVDDAIAHVYLTGAEDFGTDRVYFSTTKQKYATNYIWLGGRHADGSPLKGKGMWFGKRK